MDQQQKRETQPKQEAALPKKDIQISHATKDKVEACKQYIERKYARMIQEERDKKESWAMLLQKMSDLNMKPNDQEFVKSQILHKEAEYLRRKRQRVGAKDFEPLKIIGRGAFGEVRVCRDKRTGEVVAIKKMKKSEMLAKNQIAHVRAERDVLALSDIPWVVDLKYSFQVFGFDEVRQDDKYLYLVMEYLPGGDLMTLLMKKDILNEEDSKFYIAELVLAVDAIHKMNFIHRDLKPDNILIDFKGHLKLSDFGLCKHTEIKPRIDFGRKANEPMNKFEPSLVLTKRPQNFKRNRQLAFSTVGTPDYIAPEVFSQQGYTETVDWWSIGVILFEMVVGYPPFFSDDPQTTCQKILHWKRTFQIPQEPVLSQPCIDLIRRLIADPTERLGINGVQEIKAHPFFFGVDWKKIRDKPTPYVPEIKSQLDTDNFEAFQEEDPWYVPEGKKRGRKSQSPTEQRGEQGSFVIGERRTTKLKPADSANKQFVKTNLNPNTQVLYNYNLYHQGAKSNSPQNKKQQVSQQQAMSARGTNPLQLYAQQVGKNQFLINTSHIIDNEAQTSSRNIPTTPKGNPQATQLIAMLSSLNNQQQQTTQGSNGRASKVSINNNNSTTNNQTKNGSQVIINKFNVSNNTQNYLLAQATLNNSNNGLIKPVPAPLPKKGGLPNLQQQQGSPKNYQKDVGAPYLGNIQLRQQQTYQYATVSGRDGSPKYKN